METSAVAAIVVGGVVIALRAPLLARPEATLRAYRAALASSGRVRASGVALGALGIFVVAATRSPAGVALRILALVGWAQTGGGAFLVAFPDLGRRFGNAVLDAVADPAALRAIGALGTAIGAGFIWLGLALS